MEQTQVATRRMSGWVIALASILLALLLTVSMVQGLSAQTDADESTPPATPTEPGEGDGETGGTPEATESLTATVEASPGAGLAVTGTVTVTEPGAGDGETGGTPEATESLTATVEASPGAGLAVTGTVTVTEPAEIENPEIVASPSGPTTTIILPIVMTPLPQIAISGTRPNSNNQWQIQWQDFGDDYSYRIQESQRPDFADLIINESLQGTSRNISHSATAFNTYYYRVRPEGNNLVGPWSRTLAVSGAYRDDFDDPNTGWTMRRTTFLERTVSWYSEGDNAGRFIIVVDDRWDWMIASPLQAAPKPPYVIKYRARVNDASNLVSGGVSVGGDWNYDACPEFGNVYQTDNCFNHFYNFNYIYYGGMKLLFEQVDRLEWCPKCDGSPLKRLGNENNWREIGPIFGNSSAEDWHTYRVEVRDSGLYLTIDGDYKGKFGSPAYVNDPFFGVFASTDEYKPSIWMFDYFEITPLDS